MASYRSYRPSRGRFTRPKQDSYSYRRSDEDVDSLNDETFGDDVFQGLPWEETHRRFAELDLKTRGLDTASLDDNHPEQQQDFDVERALSKLVEDDDYNLLEQGDLGKLPQTAEPAGLETGSSHSSGRASSSALDGSSEQPHIGDVLFQRKLGETPKTLGGISMASGMSGKMMTVEELEKSFISPDRDKATEDISHTAPSLLTQLLSPLGSPHMSPISSGGSPGPVTTSSMPTVTQHMSPVVTHVLPLFPRPLSSTVPMPPFPLAGPHSGSPLLMPRMPMPFHGQAPPGIPPRLAHQFTELARCSGLPQGFHAPLPHHWPQLPPGAPSPIHGVQNMPLISPQVPVPLLPRFDMNGQRSPVTGNEQQRYREPHPNEIEFSNATEKDPFAGLMTQKEKDYIIKIQMLQLQSQNPFADDYYYQIITMKRREQEQREKAAQDCGDSDDEQVRKESKIVIPNVTVEAREYKPPVASEGSLGKITVSSITGPRKMLDIHPSTESDIVKVDAHSSLRRKLLIIVENVYDLLLKIEELEKRALALPDADAGPLNEAIEQSRDKIMKLIGINDLDITMCYQEDKNFVHLMSIRKGRALIGRVIQVLPTQQAGMVVAKVFTHIAHILKRDSQDLPGVLSSGSFVVAKAIRSLSMKAIVHILSSLASSEDVVCDFVAHVTEAVVLRASELLFEDPANVEVWSNCCSVFCNHTGPKILAKLNSSSKLLAQSLVSHPYVPTMWQVAFKQLVNTLT